MIDFFILLMKNYILRAMQCSVFNDYNRANVENDVAFNNNI